MRIFRALKDAIKKKKRQISSKSKKVKKYVVTTMKKRETADSFTKRKVETILNHAIIWVYLTYILAFVGKDAIAENLSITVVKVIIYTFIPYLCKSLFENVFKYGKFNFKENPYVAEETNVTETDNTDVTKSTKSEVADVPEENCAG